VRRLLGSGVLALALAAAIVVVVLLVVNGGGGGYTVRAEFDNAGYAAPGEQVRIAGAPVGTIASETVTKQNLAVLVLKITAPGFTPWHANATCTIRPQSLISERYVECSPGTSAQPALARITRGDGAGGHLLPVGRTSSPVDPDIVQDISTEPVREALSTIIDELGTGLAARGADLNAVIRRADPGLAATDRVFSLLATQNRTLAELATDSDRVLAPLARARASLAGFVLSANATASAAATRSTQIAASIKALPPALAQLKPLMSDLGRLARQGTPALANLGQSAGALNREFTSLVPFASKAKTALQDLSTAAARSESNLVASVPLARRLDRVGSAAEPSAQSLATLTDSLSKTDAISQLTAFLFNGAGATNGFDADGHYLRTDLLVGSCTGYARSAIGGCSAGFSGNPGGAGFASSSTTKVQTDRLSGLLSYLTGDSK
jgi:phospholipid/cholesterol/gamma-HCH transport system substrate-binding protein